MVTNTPIAVPLRVLNLKNLRDIAIVPVCLTAEKVKPEIGDLNKSSKWNYVSY